MEARSDYKNSGLQAVASVIWNRSGGDTNKIVKICFEKYQFSAWNKYNPSENPEFLPEKYKSVVPTQAKNNIIEKRAWDRCLFWAKQMLENKFVSNIGNRNMYATAAVSEITDWWKDMQNPTRLGEFGQNHIFGYLPEHDGFRI